MIIRNVSTKAVLSFLALLEMTNFAFWEGSWWRQSRHQLPHTLAVVVIPNDVRNLYPGLRISEIPLFVRNDGIHFGGGGGGFAAAHSS